MKYCYHDGFGIFGYLIHIIPKLFAHWATELPLFLTNQNGVKPVIV
jgi:hypothetical protein